MRIALAIGLLVFLTATLFHAAAAETPAPVDRAPADVSLIAAWIAGSDEGKAFEHDFGDSRWITDAKDAIFYSDVDNVAVPPKLRRVSYDFISPRMDKIRGAHKVDPAVLITRSVAEDSAERGFARRNRTPKPGERIYYIEVAIGNRAWHWMKVAVYEVDGKPKVQFLWSMVS
jgi:hypothetical protein